MKKGFILIILLGIWAILAPWDKVYAIDDPMSASGVSRFVEKPEAPDFTLVDLEGNPIKLEDFRNKIVLIFFWTTW